MNEKIESISKKEGKNALNIIMIDEMCPSPNNDTDPKVNATGDLEHDWSDLKSEMKSETAILRKMSRPCRNL